MPHGMEVGLGPGHIVLDGDPAPPPSKVWPNGWMDQDGTWYGDRPRLSARPMSIVAKRLD